MITKILTLMILMTVIIQEVNSHKICLSACGGGLRSAIFTQELKKFFNKGNEIIIEAGISGGSWGLCANKEIQTGMSWNKYWGMIKIADMMFETQWREIVSEFLTERNGFFLNHCGARIYYAARKFKDPHKCDPDTPFDICFYDAKTKLQHCDYENNFKPDIITALSVSSSALSSNQAKCLSSGFINQRRMKSGDFEFYDLGSFNNCPMSYLIDECSIIINLHGSEERDSYNAFYYDIRKRLVSTKSLIDDNDNWVAKFKIKNNKGNSVYVLSIQTWEAVKFHSSISTTNQAASSQEITKYRSFIQSWLSKNKLVLDLNSLIDDS